MQWLIDGTAYDADELDPTGLDMRAMSKQAGMGFYTWQRLMGQLERLGFDDDGNVVVLSETEAKEHPERLNPGAMFDSEPHLTALLVTIWLTRRGAGEKLSFEESASVPFSRIDRLDDEPDDEPADDGEAPDPTQPPASAADAGDGSATSTGS